MLRIAVPNKGSLSEPAVQMLREAGYRQRRDPRELVLPDPDNDVEFFFLRPRDVAVYVGQGTVDVGITGRDLLIDSGSAATEHLPLGFGRSTFRFAATAGELSGVEEVAGRRIATSYPVLVTQFLGGRGIAPASVVRLDGAVESSIRLGVADVIADVVETGTTLRAAGLEVFGEPILRSEAVMVRGAGADDNELAVLTRRLQGVLTAREYVLMDYDVPISAVERAVGITPGLESPTVSPLHDKQWCAVRAMVPRAATNRVMDDLYDVGARAIIVTSIHACRL
ncbi:MAG: ATP phosphoribosyltransferase [Cellulomonas sp.]|nr:ATP phosphoribosyltransferase [Cellulomonas sp.]